MAFKENANNGQLQEQNLQGVTARLSVEAFPIL